MPELSAVRSSRGVMMTSTTHSPNGPHQLDSSVLTLSEAASFLQVSEEGLRQDADGGLLPGRKVAGEWRFAKHALVTWLSSAVPVVQKASETTGSHDRVIRKAIPADLNEGFHSSIGAFIDDDTLEPMIESIYRSRKASADGG